MKHCTAPRQEMGVRTLLNILGPLANPAGAAIQVLGVYEEGLTELLARVLLRLGTQHCFLVHGMDGLDEITLTDRTRVSEGKAGGVSSYPLGPSDFGRGRVRVEDLGGGTGGEKAPTTAGGLRGGEGAEAGGGLLEAPAAVVGGRQGGGLQGGS